MKIGRGDRLHLPPHRLHRSQRASDELPRDGADEQQHEREAEDQQERDDLGRFRDEIEDSCREYRPCGHRCIDGGGDHEEWIVVLADGDRRRLLVPQAGDHWCRRSLAPGGQDAAIGVEHLHEQIIGRRKPHILGCRSALQLGDDLGRPQFDVRVDRLGQAARRKRTSATAPTMSVKPRTDTATPTVRPRMEPICRPSPRVPRTRIQPPAASSR